MLSFKHHLSWVSKAEGFCCLLLSSCVIPYLAPRTTQKQILMALWLFILESLCPSLPWELRTLNISVDLICRLFSKWTILGCCVHTWQVRVGMTIPEGFSWLYLVGTFDISTEYVSARIIFKNYLPDYNFYSASILFPLECAWLAGVTSDMPLVCSLSPCEYNFWGASVTDGHKNGQRWTFTWCFYYMECASA